MCIVCEMCQEDPNANINLQSLSNVVEWFQDAVCVCYKHALFIFTKKKKVCRMTEWLKEELLS